MDTAEEPEAQTVEPTVKPVAAKKPVDEYSDSAYVLPVFEVDVSKDVGYLAQSQQSGTLLASLIQDTPINISVISQELIEDIGANDMKEALAYESGLTLETFESTSNTNQDFKSGEVSPSSNIDVSNPFANAVTIRGYKVPNQQREGFRIGAIVAAYGVNLGGETDAVNIERMEVVRGPNSLLYGINVLSGIVNILPRKPESVEATRTSMVVGNYDYFRTTIDHTAPILDDGSLNYRVAAAYTQEGDWTDYLIDKSTYYVGQLEWRPTYTASILFELQYSDSIREGGGQQFFVDGDDPSTNDRFHNEYSEYFAYGYDFTNQAKIMDPEAQGMSDVTLDSGILVEGDIYGRAMLVKNPDNSYNFNNKGRGYRISGPDVYYSSKEFNAMLLYRDTFFDDLNIEVGGYYTTLDNELFNVKLITFTDSYGYMNPSRAISAANDPEYDGNDPYGYGTGELFVYIDDLSGELTEERRYAGYYWYKQPTQSETLQLRARAAYKLRLEETQIFGMEMPMVHTFALGTSFVRDDVEFVQNNTINNPRYAYWYGQSASIASRQDSDPWIYRDSIFDTSVIHYNGETLATPGNFRYVDHANTDTYLLLSGHKKATQWFRGAYGIYQGEFWGDRLNIIAGVRHDTYQVREQEQLFISDKDLETDQWLTAETGSTTPTPYSLGYGTEAYTSDRWHNVFTDEFNTKVQAELDSYIAAHPNGTASYNFPEAEKYTTKLGSFSLKVMEGLNFFYLYSEGIFPNTGQRDGTYAAIEAEQTESNEIGIKFDLLKNRISGTFSAFKIKRHNAVWYWENAPNPSVWYGGPYGFQGREEGAAFSPDAVIDGRAMAGKAQRTYGVAGQYIHQALLDAGLDPNYDDYMNRLMGELGVYAIETQSSGDPTAGKSQYTYYFINYDKAKEVDATREGGNPLLAAMDAAQVNELDLLGRSMTWGNSGINGPLHNASANNTRGANVRFEEEGTGFDTRFIITPFENDDRWQVILSYSQQKREVVGAGFELAPGYALDQDGNQILDANGNPYLMTTEYDYWVGLLGRDSFEDPSNPATLKEGSSISGIDLSFVPRTSWSIWNNYKIKEGPLKNLSLALGVVYTSSIPTTISIGGANLRENLWPTPDLPERYVLNAAISYKWEWDFGYGKTDWRLSLNVNNLLNDWISEAVVVYDDPSYEEPIVRRSLKYYDPRYYRLSLSVNF